jgi:cytidylate kinase
VHIDGHDVTAAIRTTAMDAAAATVARHAAVRRVLVARQREMGRDGGVVMEGRDIGTVVFPRADVKVYLDATPEERARRRAGDVLHAASQSALAADRVGQVAQALQERDLSDRTRTVSPLTLAADAVYIDTTGVSIENVVAQVMALIRPSLP